MPRPWTKRSAAPPTRARRADGFDARDRRVRSQFLGRARPRQDRRDHRGDRVRPRRGAPRRGSRRGDESHRGHVRGRAGGGARRRVSRDRGGGTRDRHAHPDRRARASGCQRRGALRPGERHFHGRVCRTRAPARRARRTRARHSRIPVRSRGHAPRAQEPRRHSRGRVRVLGGARRQSEVGTGLRPVRVSAPTRRHRDRSASLSHRLQRELEYALQEARARRGALHPREGTPQAGSATALRCATPPARS